MVLITCNAVGDIIALATLLLDAIHALNDARGSAAEYHRFKSELNGLHTIVRAAARVAQDSVDDAQGTEPTSPSADKSLTWRKRALGVRIGAHAHKWQRRAPRGARRDDGG